MKLIVDTHTHTIASTHAYSTIHDYIATAKQKGIKLFATTDHGPAMTDAPHFWHFINLRVLPHIVDGIGILRGVEANIKNIEGEIDIFGDLLDDLDLIQAGFHDPVYPSSDKDAHTQAMINTMASGKVDIITHPGNSRYPIDIEEVVQAAVKFNVALEVNNSSHLSRKGSEENCLEIIKAAKHFGARLVVASDSHVAYTLGEFSEAIKMLEAVSYPWENLINYTPRTLLNFLITRGHKTIDDEMLAHFPE